MHARSTVFKKKEEKKRSRAMGNSPTPTFKQVNKVNIQEIAPPPPPTLLRACPRREFILAFS